MDMNFKRGMIDIIGEQGVFFDEPMSLHTTFRVGGPADVLAVPACADDLVRAVDDCRAADVPYMIIGNGSNLLIGDRGIRGVVFQIFHTMDEVSFSDGAGSAESGDTMLSKVASEHTGSGVADDGAGSSESGDRLSPDGAGPAESGDTVLSDGAGRHAADGSASAAAVVPELSRVLVRAGAGMPLPKLAHMAAERGLSGLEFASGIPGTFGGALAMNAGAYGGEMRQCVRRVRIMDASGRTCWLAAKDLRMGYRTSLIKENRLVVLEAELLLERGDRAEIGRRMDAFARQRAAKQPLEYPSAGSTFKRPNGYFAGQLIEEAGLRGYRVGGACVSEKHCGFVINDRDASAADILELIRDVQRIVMEKTGVMLEPEVQILGEF